MSSDGSSGVFHIHSTPALGDWIHFSRFPARITSGPGCPKIASASATSRNASSGSAATAKSTCGKASRTFAR